MKRAIGIIGLLTVVASPAALAAKPNDVGVIGPNGEVMLYYRDGDQIVVKNCAQNTVLGSTIAEARRNCSGPENRVPVQAFKQALRSMINVDRASILRPLTPEQVKALNSGQPPTEDELAAMQKELDQIEAFIKAYGPENANLGRRDQLVKDLAANKLKSDAIKAANDQIDRTIDLISSNQLTITKNGTDQGQFLFTALKQFDPSKVECGLDELMNGVPGDGGGGHGTPAGARPAAWLNWLMPNAYAKSSHKASRKLASSITVEDRIQNCSRYPGSVKKTNKNVTWNLVARKRDRSTGRYYEVWKDSSTGLLWGDRLDSTYSHYNAVALATAPCQVDHNAPNYSKNCPVTSEKACGSAEGKRAQAGVNEKSFGIPTIQEFLQAEKDGVREVAPNMAGQWYWSASLDSIYPEFARLFYGGDGGAYNVVVFRSYGDASVRCVGR
jgi:hypothetical protein